MEVAAFSKKKANMATADLKAAMPAATQERIVLRGLETPTQKKSRSMAALKTAPSSFPH